MQYFFKKYRYKNIYNIRNALKLLICNLPASGYLEIYKCFIINGYAKKLTYFFIRVKK